MLLSEAKEILIKNGYMMSEAKLNFRQWRTKVANELSLAGFDKSFLSKVMKSEYYSSTLTEMWEDNVNPKDAAAWVISNI